MRTFIMTGSAPDKIQCPVCGRWTERLINSVCRTCFAAWLARHDARSVYSEERQARRPWRRSMVCKTTVRHDRRPSAVREWSYTK